jgi:hypothetical protein
LVAGSASAVSVTTAGVCVLSTVRVKYFQVPNTSLGGIAVPPYCQSPAWLFGPLTVRSVMKSDGYKGRPDTSLPC